MKRGLFTVAAVLASVSPTSAWGQDLDNAEFFLGESGALSFTVMDSGAPRGCNEVSFAAIPGDTAHVIGRYNNACASQSFSLARYAIDWDARTLTLVNLAFDTSGGGVAITKGDSVSTAYDATVMAYNGELWVAFECGGDLVGTATASSCVGPMDPTTGVLDASRTNVVVLGNDSLGDGYYYSGSVPELLNFNGTPYIYWSAVKIDAASGDWANITGRGMQLAEVPASGGQLWNAELGSWVGSADPAHTTEVWGLGTDAATDDSVADLQGVFTNGTDIFVTAGVAGTGCGMPFWPPTCYAFAVSKAASPLATDVFNNGTRLSSSELPSNTHSYSRYIVSPSGQGYILGGYYTNSPGARPLPIAGGANAAYVTAYPIPTLSSYFAPLGGSLAFPTSGTSISNADGRLEAFAIGTDDTLYHAWQGTPGGTWSGWASLTGGIVSSPTVQRNTDGRLEAFAIAADRSIMHTWQTSAGGAWNGAWESLGGVANGGPVVDRNVDGSLDAFVVGTNGAVFHDQQGAGGVWNGWISLGGNVVGSPTVTRNADGRLEVFVVNASGALLHSWQGSPGGDWNGTWDSLGGVVASPVVARNADGRLEVFAVGQGSALFHLAQTTAGGAWSPTWASIGGVVTSPTVAVNADGRLEVFAVGDDLAIYHAWQTTPGGPFSALASLGGDYHGASAQRNANGLLEIQAVAFGGTVDHNVQTATGWSGWTTLGGAALPYPFASTDDDQPIVVAAPDGGVTDDAGETGTRDGGNGEDASKHGGSRDAGHRDATSAGSDGGGAGTRAASSCGCSVPGRPVRGVPLVGVAAMGIALRIRRRRNRGRGVVGATLARFTAVLLALPWCACRENPRAGPSAAASESASAPAPSASTGVTAMDAGRPSLVREEKTVVVDGAVETWKLMWRSPPVITSDVPWHTPSGPAFGETGDLDR